MAQWTETRDVAGQIWSLKRLADYGWTTGQTVIGEAADLILVLFGHFAHNAQYSPDDIADCHLTWLCGDQSSSYIADALDEILRTSPSLFGDDLEEQFGSGDGARS